jgi:hypothetical protein
MKEICMKELFKLKAIQRIARITVLAAVIGFSLAGCSGGASGGGKEPALTGTVSISGSAEVGQTLTADTASLGGNGTISYQWKRGNTVIGANSKTYTVQAVDAGETITVTVTRAGYSGSITSEPTGVVTDPSLPALTGTVSISGTAAVGQTLTANISALGGTGTITYQWKRGSVVIGANSNTYAVAAADIGSTITVTITRSGNSGHVTSNPTDVVIDPSLPALTGTVSISGTAAVGQTLTADTTALGGSGDISYQWKRGTTVIGANSNTYAVAADDIGETITVTVTRSGNSGHVTSNPTDVVIDPSLPALTGTVNISGSAEVGQTLTADTTALGGSGDISYQWKRGGDTVIGTNSDTYAVTAADIGETITVTVTRSGNSGHVISEPTAAVTDPSLPALTGTVSISGTAAVGQTLTADITALEGTGTISYQWKRESVMGVSAVIGTNQNTYVVVAADVGETITVTVTRTGNSGSVTSDPTAAVPDPSLPALTGTVSISGIAEAGQTLTAVTTSLDGTGVISYQWKRGEDTDIGTNSSTYAVVADDVGSTITVTVTRAGYNGSKTSDPTAVVLATPGTVNITVTIGTDAAISGPSIVDGVLTLARSGSATLTLANSGQYDEDSIRWKVQNTAISGSGGTFELNAANPVYQTGKLYFVTVEATKNGVPYDQTITFTVAE